MRNTGHVLSSSRAMMLGVECSSVELRVAPGSFVCLDFVFVGSEVRSPQNFDAVQ